MASYNTVAFSDIVEAASFPADEWQESDLQEPRGHYYNPIKTIQMCMFA